ncbi:MAG: tetratricopeptide repeat protein [Salinivirgaceae bacterium]|jgi:tetratricopeptide (TPR) repeat protein|nr:tetratricopeptide repeat protein [Salinivirgaceae bacterium]
MAHVNINKEENEILKEAAEKVKRNNFSEAIVLYESVINENQNNFNAYYSLGILYEKLNDTDKAKDVYLKGIKRARSYHDKVAETNFSYTLLGLIELTV